MMYYSILTSSCNGNEIPRLEIAVKLGELVRKYIVMCKIA